MIVDWPLAFESCGSEHCESPIGGAFGLACNNCIGIVTTILNKIVDLSWNVHVIVNPSCYVYVQSWLPPTMFPRVDHWDLERERVVILTNNNVIVVKYNFIQQRVEELKYIPINAITKAVFGDFQYPYSYAL